MAKQPNPDIYRPMDVPDSLRPYVRRALFADTHDNVNMSIDVRATGYHYIGWVWRGRWQGQVNGETRFDSDIDGPLHLTGQVKKSDVVAKVHRDIGQIFLEFTALGHFQLLGIPGAQISENAKAPHAFNPTLKPHFENIFSAKDLDVPARMALIADVLSQLPKHDVAPGIVSAIARIEAADGVIKISELITELGLAERKFRTDFKSLVGLTPKAFCTTLQINQALNHLLTNNGGDLAGIAVQTGFSDQAHFTRAFSDFLGKAPGGYLGDIEITLARFVGQSRQ